MIDLDAVELALHLIGEVRCARCDREPEAIRQSGDAVLYDCRCGRRWWSAPVDEDELEVMA